MAIDAQGWQVINRPPVRFQRSGAMAALPVYVLAPKLYGDELGMSLGLLGAVLFGARLVDTLQDPWLGRVVDRWQQRGWLGGEQHTIERKP